MRNTLTWISLITAFLVNSCGLPPEPDLSSVAGLEDSKILTEEEWDALADQRTACPGEGSVLDAATRSAVISCNQSLQYYDRLSTNTDGSGVPGSCTGQILAPIPCDIGQFNKFLPESLVTQLNEIIQNPSQPVYQGQLDQCILITQPNDSRIAGESYDLDITKNAVFICYFATPKTSGAGFDFSQNLIIPLNTPVPAKYYN